MRSVSFWEPGVWVAGQGESLESGSPDGREWFPWYRNFGGMESTAALLNRFYSLKNGRGELHSPLGNLARLSIWDQKITGIEVQPDDEFGRLGECDEGRDEDATVNRESKKAGTFQRIRIFEENFSYFNWMEDQGGRIPMATNLRFQREGLGGLTKGECNSPLPSASKKNAVNQIFHHR